jgi:molybdopterin molybdotransferase
VVAIERTRTTSDASGVTCVVLEPGTGAGANVRGAGEDFAAGDPVIAAGAMLGPEALMALAATGTAALDARGPARVALLTTGNELRPAGSDLGEAGISDANGPYLEALVATAGCSCVARRHAGDRLPDLVAALTALRADADVIVTTGGVSAGSHDLVPAAVAAAGGEILFHKVAIRPGKPLLVARFPDDRWLLGLPGNPVAVAVGARFFLVPLLRALLGRPPEVLLHALATTEIRSRGGLWFFGKARVRASPTGQLQVDLLPGQESFRVAPLVAANAWVVVPPAPGLVAAGEAVVVAPLAPAGDWLTGSG